LSACAVVLRGVLRIRKKTLSEPEIPTVDEAAHLRTENIRLKRELDRVRESLRKTASVVGRDRSQLSPAFATLADDLNVVKSDLEQILTTMESGVPHGSENPAEMSASSASGKSAAEDEELLHSVSILLDNYGESEEVGKHEKMKYRMFF
ncbi:hypothetical protein OESDEN_06380, partial [Oesophagostomum dentatum]